MKMTMKNELEPFRRESPPTLFKAQLFLGRTLFSHTIGYRTRRLGFNSFLKAGRHIDLSEANTLRYLAKHTSVPVPKVQRAWRSDGVTYILMNVVKGVELEVAWRSMSHEAKKRVIEQLKGYLAQLRALQPPAEGVVASLNGGSLRDCARVGFGLFGPFANHDDFHRFLRVSLPLGRLDGIPGGDDVAFAHRQRYATKFTHGDLAPRNIMIKKDGTITAIVDWDSAGWFPEYWEHTKANFNSICATDDWIECVGEITGGYDEQLAGEWNLQDLCGVLLT